MTLTIRAWLFFMKLLAEDLLSLTALTKLFVVIFLLKNCEELLGSCVQYI